MSEFGYCKKGDMDGIVVNDKELFELSDKLKLKYLDEVIPLPGKTPEEQSILIKECDDDHDDNKIYFERECGSHGWCCPKCGTVTQWG